MKPFLIACAFSGLAAVATGTVFRYSDRTATEVHSADSARPAETAVGRRDGWRPDG